jgi:hypothetical protein
VGTIDLVRADPPDGTTLRKGQSASLTITVRYSLKSLANARASLVVQDQDGLPLIPQPEAQAVSESGELALKGTFVVPDEATHVSAFVALSTPQRGPTNTMVSVRYRVE